MTFRRSFLALVLGVLVTVPAFAQDRIHQKDGVVFPKESSTQKIQVTKETYTVIKYKLESRGVSLDQEMSTSKVNYVQYARKNSDFTEAMDAFNSGGFEDALELFTGLAKRKSPHWLKQHSLFRAAECQYAMGDWDAAITGYERLRAEVSDSRFVPEAQLKIAMCKLNKNDVEGARADFGKLKRDVGNKDYDPEYEFRADLGLIEIDERAGKFSVALSELEKLQAKVGDDYPAVASATRLRIGSVYIQERQYKKAENYFKAILEADSETTDPAVVFGAYIGLGDSYFAQSKFKEALKDCYLRVVVMDDREGTVPQDVLAKALFWSARCWDQLRNEKPEYGKFAYDLYREVTRRAPGSAIAQEARKYIRR